MIIARLEAISIGLNMVCEKGFSKVVIASDSLSEVMMIKGMLYLASLLQPCEGDSEPHAPGGDCYIHRTLREANQVADALAKFGMNLDSGTTTFDTVPYFVSLQMRADLSGVVFPRGF